MINICAFAASVFINLVSLQQQPPQQQQPNWTWAFPPGVISYFLPPSGNPVCNCDGSNPTTSVPVPDNPEWEYTGGCDSYGYCEGTVRFGRFPGTSPQPITIPQGMCVDRVDFTITSSWVPPAGVSTYPRLCTDGCEAGTYIGVTWNLTPHLIACPTPEETEPGGSS